MADIRFAALATLAALPAAALAAETPYLDDRSDPAALVRSLYNAIDRQEYARAYSYFATPPAADPDAYAQGFADTRRVRVVTGVPSEEGAAGSVYYQLPVAIEATGSDNATRVFAGCYTLKMANPAVQGVPYEPLHIESGALQPADGPLAGALPQKCGDGPPPPKADLALQAAREAFVRDYAGRCQSLAGDAAQPPEPQTVEIAFNLASDPENAPQRLARLFRFDCTAVPQHESQVYYLAGEGGRLEPLWFTLPELDVRYENDDTSKRVEKLEIVGFRTVAELAGSTYDAGTLTLTALSKWRPTGDASSVATWIFRNGGFTLVRYDVDASYNGKVDPQNLLDYQTGP